MVNACTIPFFEYKDRESHYNFQKVNNKPTKRMRRFEA